MVSVMTKLNALRDTECNAKTGHPAYIFNLTVVNFFTHVQGNTRTVRNKQESCRVKILEDENVKLESKFSNSKEKVKALEQNYYEIQEELKGQKQQTQTLSEKLDNLD